MDVFVPVMLDVKKKAYPLSSKHYCLISKFFLPEKEMCDLLANPGEEEIK